MLIYANVKTRRPRASQETTPLSADACQVDFVDEAKVEAVQPRLLSADTAQQAAELLGAFADPTRLRLLHALSLSELCVCDLAHLVGRSMATTSRQLQQLRHLGLVKYRADGKLVYYSLASTWAKGLIHDAIRQLEGREAA
nr:metalloregulator ArsR/SmtB family transcription factor [Myxococcus xanthus]